MIENPLEATFIDTNILVYAFDETAGKKHSIAVKIIENGWNNKNGNISLQVIQEFYVTLTRKIPNPVDIRTVRKIVSDLSTWRIHSPTVEDVLQAIDIQFENKLSFWDSLLIQSAIRLGCQTLISEDLSHGQVIAGVRIFNPFIEEVS
ncbi:MAG TPA: PIN domain-containing protein [Bellilinea sp.]|nr:PIN domain-containing protein [Bellilinea sp.]